MADPAEPISSADEQRNYENETANPAMVEPKEEPLDLFNSSDQSENSPMDSKNGIVENSHHEPQPTYEIVNDHDYCLVDWRIGERYSVAQGRYERDRERFDQGAEVGNPHLTVANQCSPSRFEPKEEPMDDFPMIPAEIENSFGAVARKRDWYGSLISDTAPGTAVVVERRNGTDMECPVCDFRTSFVSSWFTHLRSAHSTSCSQANLYLLCECGNKSQTRHHSLHCDISNFTVIRKNDDPDQKIEVQKKRRIISAIWTYFNRTEVDGQFEGTCTLCDWNRRGDNNISKKLWRHLRKKHPIHYSILKPNDVPPEMSGQTNLVEGTVDIVPGDTSSPSNLFLPRPQEEKEEKQFKEEVKKEETWEN